DVLGPAVEVRQAGLDDLRVEDVRALAQFADGLAVGGAADVMPADLKPRGLVEVEGGEGRQGGDQAGFADESAAEGGQAEGGGSGDAPAGADEPDAEAACGHGGWLPERSQG